MSMKCERAMLQDPAEMARFLQLVKGEKVTRYLEIGGKHGGSLWAVANAMPRGSTVVSVDLPHGDLSFKENLPNLEECVRVLAQRGYNAHLLVGDSTDPEVIEDVRKLGPYDLVFIDANHTEPFVRQDWANYGPMARMVAFHDIGWKPRPEPSKKMPIEVPKVWEELKQGYRHAEIKLCATRRDNGIGILWRH